MRGKFMKIKILCDKTTTIILLCFLIIGILLYFYIAWYIKPGLTNNRCEYSRHLGNSFNKFEVAKSMQTMFGKTKYSYLLKDISKMKYEMYQNKCPQLKLTKVFCENQNAIVEFRDKKYGYCGRYVLTPLTSNRWVFGLQELEKNQSDRIFTNYNPWYILIYMPNNSSNKWKFIHVDDSEEYWRKRAMKLRKELGPDLLKNEN